MIPQNSVAHTPQGMTLEYDFFAQKLNVTIEHNVGSPNTHYIEQVEIQRNANIFLIQNYTSQPSTSTFTYTYDIPAVAGDLLQATGFCSISGSINAQLAVVDPTPQEYNLAVTPQVTEVSENTDQRFNVSVTTNDQPVEDVALEVKATHGTIIWPPQVPNEPYEFIYTAPEVAEDTGETVNITASKEGYITEYTELYFTIKATAQPPKPDIKISITPPSISSIKENGFQNFNVTVTADSQPLDDVTPSINAAEGSISEIEAISGNVYQFTYFSPEVDLDTDETITISAEKDGYNDGFKQLQFTITYQPTNGNDHTLDGTIDADEYEYSVSFAGGDYKLHWRLDGELIHMAMEGKTNGWVAIGFEPKKRMEDADMVFGWVMDNGIVEVVDAYSTGQTGPHPPDTDLEGTDDILAFGGAENNGWTIIEFIRLLDTDDDFDNKLREKGEIDIIWAMGSNDNFEDKHSKVGSGTIDLATGEASEDILLWPIHAILMVLGFVFMVIGSIIALFMKKKRWWLKAHKGINILATIFAILGLIMAFYMVAEASGDHFRVPHAYVGLITIIFVIISPILGFKMLNPQSPSKKLRAVHRAIGRITIILMLVNILIGLSVAGII